VDNDKTGEVLLRSFLEMQYGYTQYAFVSRLVYCQYMYLSQATRRQTITLYDMMFDKGAYT
jgi:hypothetical protein